MRKILVLLLLATLAMLALPQIVLAGEHGNNAHGLGDLGEHEHRGLEVNASFHVRLTGDQQVPTVDTTAFGLAKVQLIDNTTLMFSLMVCNIANVTLAHIHVGAAGTNGLPVIPFFDESKYPFSVTHGCAVLSAGIRTPSDLIPRPESGINNWNDFVHALLTNNTYINVHTTAHPGGEIRAQLISHPSNEHEEEQSQQIEQGDAEESDD